MKKARVFLTLLLVCLCLVGCGKDKKYEKATNLYIEGDYKGSLEIFESLNDFLDSAKMVNANKYRLAEEKMSSGQYAEAITDFSALGAFWDAPQKVTACEAQLDPFGTLYNYYVKNNRHTDGNYLDGMYSLTGDGVYLQGATEKGNLLFSYISSDGSTTVSILLSEDKQLTIGVEIETGTENVFGMIQMAASEYDPNVTLKKFKYQATGTRWNYEGFEARANAYIRNTLRYAAFQIHSMDVGLSLQALGLTGYDGTGELMGSQFITDNDLAGLWEAEGGSTYYFTGDSVYTGTTSIVGDLLKEQPWGGNLKTSIYDPAIGMKVVTFDCISKRLFSQEDSYHCFVWRGDDGTLYLRIESQVLGLGTPLDGKILIKAQDDETATLTPGKIQWETESEETSSASVYEPKTYTMDGIDTTGAGLNAIHALERAISYLNAMPFSHDGLIEQLQYEGFSYTDALFAADHCGGDWNTEAQRMAFNYLKTTAFSRKGMIEQLEYEEFTHEQAIYGADNIGMDWYIQAVRKANQYSDIFSFSQQEMIEQLEYEGFTHDEALYAVEHN